MPFQRVPAAQPGAGGGPASKTGGTMPTGMPTSVDQGLPQFGTGQGLGGQPPSERSSPVSKPGWASAFKGIPQLDNSQ
jgi:hypothetical protein